ncbi:hypothetical protein INR49_017557 [Caranx melampygus]|nr:hypothetical protein INR49_017557 [Caranx melampygus]
MTTKQDQYKDVGEVTCVPGGPRQTAAVAAAAVAAAANVVGAPSCAPETKGGNPRFGCFHGGLHRQLRERHRLNGQTWPSSPTSSPPLF